MSRRQRARYLLAVYLIVAFIAIILGLIAFNRGTDAWQSLLLNLSTELLGVVFVFFLVNYFFLLGDWDLSERVERLVKRLELRDRPTATGFFAPIPSIDSHIEKATRIDLCGVTLSSIMRKQKTNLHGCLWAGCNIRLLIIDPDSPALEEADYRSDLGTVSTYRRALDTTFQDIEHLLRKWDSQRDDTETSMLGKLSVRLLPYLPPFGIRSFDANQPNGTLFVEIYPHRTPSKSPTFELTAQNDGEWYQYFVTQYDRLWENARPWEPNALMTQTEKAS
jgi:hypothetical protein